MRSLAELQNMKGRTALITGGGGHLGRAFGEALAELGAAVAVLDVDLQAAEAAAEDLGRRFQVETLALHIDLEDDARVKEVPGILERKFGGLDVLVNNAAFYGKLEGWAEPFERQTVDAWRKVLNVNLTASFGLTQACAELLKAHGRGAVVNVASIYGMVGPDMRIYDGTSMANPAAYGAGKAGTLQLTRWLATVLAPHVRVNAITPGGVSRGQPESFTAAYEHRTPMARMAGEEDFKGAVAYLASDLSRYVTGHNLVVDGGWTAW